MSRERVDRLTGILPGLEELGPVLDHILTTAKPDPRHAWSASGEVGTVEARLVDIESLEKATEELANRVRERLVEVYGRVARIARALEADDRETVVHILVELAELEEAAERTDRAESYAMAAVDVARELRNPEPRALALRRAGRAARARGHLEPAMNRYREAWTIGGVVGPPQDAAEAAIGAGNVLEEQGRWKEAETWYRKALERLDEVDGPAPERWQAALNIHIVLRSRGEVEASRPWLEEAQREAELLPGSGAAPFLGSAQGQLRMAEEDLHGAERAFRQALEQADDARARVTIRLNLAESLLAQSRVLEAGEEAREAEAEALAAGVVSRLPEVYRLLGRVAAQRENPSAHVLFERALRIIDDRRLPALERAVTLQAYAELERSRGDDETASALLEQAKRIYDELDIRHLRRRWVDLFSLDTDGPTKDGDRDA